MRNPRGQMGALVHSHCASASLLAASIGLSERVQAVLGATFERYDGAGGPHALAGGDQLPIEMRVAQLANLVEVHDRTYGPGGAEHMVRSRRGGQFDPAVADEFLSDPQALLAAPEQGSYWDAALSEAPDHNRPLTPVELDQMLVALGDFVDLKCPFTLGHSRAVADLAARAATHLGLDGDDVAAVRRAGHVHDIGRIGISNRVREAAADLSAEQWERVRLHPYLTARIVERVSGLGDVARIASNHHEQPDGGGYPRTLAAASLPMPDRVLAAAVTYESALELLVRSTRRCRHRTAGARHSVAVVGRGRDDEPRPQRDQSGQRQATMNVRYASQGARRCGVPVVTARPSEPTPVLLANEGKLHGPLTAERRCSRQTEGHKG